MEEKIKELKVLVEAYESALSNDYVPSIDDLEDVIEDIDYKDLDNLKEALEKYEGYSCSDLESKIVIKIKDL